MRMRWKPYFVLNKQFWPTSGTTADIHRVKKNIKKIRNEMMNLD